MSKVLLLNSPILTTTGSFVLKDIELTDTVEIMKENGFISAIGHSSTADIMSTLLGLNVECNRITATQEPGQKAIVFKLLSRPEEGKILTLEEIKEIGYKFQLLERTE